MSDSSTILRGLAGDVVDAVRGEWDSRTTYGKVWFPIWLLWTTYYWFCTISFLALIGLAARIVVLFRRDRPNESLTPAVHKDEVNDR